MSVKNSFHMAQCRTNLGDSVGLVPLHNSSGQRAVGSILGHDLSSGVLSGVRSGSDIAAGVDSSTRHTGDGRQNSGNGRETHCDFGISFFF